ncbi:PilZ domain-containing protein [Marinobacter fonticola]|uniref:PilZ domain-containing protein n=1 Tax=Marinobacter fonticola TaxID=2603215 RepID=UPI00143CFCDA|nr:PilZ domain-containing protein [Marinobacter fonticola]
MALASNRTHQTKQAGIEMWQGEERRRFYRVDDRVALRYVRLSDKASLSAELVDLSLRTRQVDIDLALDQALAKLAETAPETREVIDLLNRKLDLVLEALGDEVDGLEAGSLVARDINLSAGGLSFRTQEAIADEESLLVDLLFYPERRTVRILARVVGMVPEDGEFRVHLDFERITDTDRELLMSHIMRLQSSKLRERDGAARDQS